jgi:hypothetical protein
VATLRGGVDARLAACAVSALSRTRLLALVLLVAVLVWLAVVRWMPGSVLATLPSVPRLEQQLGSVAHNPPWWIGLVVVWLVACLLLAARRR